MKKSILIFVLILLCTLSSCSLFPLIPGGDKSEEDPVKTMFFSSETMFSDFFFDAYSSGTNLEFSDFEKLRSADFRKDSALLSVNSLSILGRELASKEKELSVSINSLRDKTSGNSYGSTDVTYGSEKLSAVRFGSRDSSVSAFSCLAETYVEFPADRSIKDVMREFLSSDVIGIDRFSLSRSDCRYGESVIKDTQKITLDLSGTDLCPLVSELFKYFDPLFSLEDEKEYILNNISSPNGTGITVYFKNGRAVCAEAVFTVDGTEYRADAFFDSSDKYQSGKISFTKSSLLTQKIFSLDFVQVTDGNQKSGTISAEFFPKEIFTDADDLPSDVTFDAEFETTLSENRQNCSLTANFAYTLYGITSSYKLPISIVTELMDGIFSASVSLSAESPEISEFDARLSVAMSAPESLEIPTISPESLSSVQTKEQAEEFISSFFSELERKYPNLRYLIFKNYRNQGTSPLNVLTLKSEDSGETFVFQISDINTSSLAGSGEYLKEFTYAESGDTLLITEHPGNQKYPLYTSSAEKVVFEDGSLMFTEKDGTVWRLFPSSMTGYFSKPVTLFALLDDGGSSGEISVYFSDSSTMFDKAHFTMTDGFISFGDSKYQYYVY